MIETHTYVHMCMMVKLLPAFLSSASKLAPKCFECNYSPSGSGGYQWQALSRAGYPSCALRHPEDSDKVDKYTCGSGVCFIREEPNGRESHYNIKL